MGRRDGMISLLVGVFLVNALEFIPTQCTPLVFLLFSKSQTRYNFQKKMTDSRWTRVGRHSYNTRQHKVRGVRTPGGVLKQKRLYKTTSGPKCSDCKITLQGIKHVKSAKYHSMKKRERTVSRTYGGSCCSACLKGRIMRAFLFEEQKAVKKVLAERSGK